MQPTTSFDYTRVPARYVHCFIDTCPRAGECLRRLTAKHIPADIPAVQAVNPASPQTGTEQCPHYQTLQKVTYAWGVAHLLDDLPYPTAVSINRAVRQLWPRTSYQRMARHERPIPPEQQRKIAAILVRYGIDTPPRYDYTTEEYNFE